MLDVQQIGGGGRGEEQQQQQQQQQQRGRYLHQAQLAGLKRLSARATAGPTKAAGGARRVFFSFSAYARSVIEHLKRAQVPIAEGLSDGEFDRIEATFSLTFPPDLKGILQEGLPVGAAFPNWRTGNFEQLRTRIDLPCAGLLHEVALGRFWWKTWGRRPAETQHAVQIASAALRAAPILIPMCGHCYIPCSPNQAGNPIFFVYQKEVVYCGYDVADFFDRELFLVHACMDPLEAPDWGEETGLGKGTNGGESFHQAHLDSLRRSSAASSGVDSSEASSSGASESGGETWGRSLDFLAKQSDGWLLGNLKRTRGCPNDPAKVKDGDATRQLTLSRSLDRKSQESDSTKIFSTEKPLPSQALMNISLAMPPWAARTPRHIDFWSDIADKQKASVAVLPQEDGLFAPCNMDNDDMMTQPPRLDSIPGKHLDVRDEAEPKNSSKWVACYLEEMSLMLRQGGWREDDISDMMGAQALPKLWNQQLDAQVKKISQLISQQFLQDFSPRDFTISLQQLSTLQYMFCGQCTHNFVH
jgi:hypothetical protein